MKQSYTRRRLIRNGLLAAMGGAFISNARAAVLSNSNETMPPDAWQKLKVGVASYSFRKLSVDDTIKALQQLDLHYISIKDFHLSLKSNADERKALVAKFVAAGITPLSCGNITMENNESSIREAFQYAADAGIPTIVCSPHPDSMPLLDKMVKEYDIKLAIHNHGPEDKRFPSPYDAWKAVERYDKRMGLCIDVGHTARAKADPAEAIIKCKDRLYDLHFKDIDTTDPKGTTVPGGRGVLNLPSILKALKKINYSHLVSIEYENAPDNPVPAVAETVGYMKGLLRNA